MKIGQWEVGEEIGRGGFGAVKIGQDRDGNKVAIKLVTEDPTAQRELLFANIENCAYIVPILSIEETRDSYAIVMPLADYSLKNYLEKAAIPVAEKEKIAILLDVAKGLQELQLNKIVHRDIKPDNILSIGGRWRITDFGISRYADSSTSPLTRKYSMTPSYASPEQLRLERATEKSDIYSFGVMAFELFSGSLPFEGDFSEL